MFKKLLPLLFIAAPVFSQPTLTVYTYNSFASEWGPGPVIKKAFEAECQCEVKIVPMADGVILFNRLRMEGNKSPADVVIGLDNNLSAEAIKLNLFAPHHLSTDKLTLPNGWNNPYLYPYDYSYFAFVYNKEKLANPPTSMQDLLANSQSWKIVYQDPRTSSVGQGLLLWMEYLYGDKVSHAWQQLAKKTLTVTKGWSEAYGLLLKGEADLALSYSASPIYHIENQNDYRYVAAPFSEGHYLQIETVGIVTSSKQPELAKQFIQFVTTPAMQSIIAVKNSMYPVVETALPNAYNHLIKIDKALSFSPEEVAKHRSEWIKTWQNAVSQ